MQSAHQLVIIIAEAQRIVRRADNVAEIRTKNSGTITHTVTFLLSLKSA